MGKAISAFFCVGRNEQDNEPLQDMSPVRSKNLPIVWLVGQPNSGKKTHGELIKQKFAFEHINITDLLRHEMSKQTQRGQLIEESFQLGKKVSDHLVMCLLKEAMLSSDNQNGFIISNFPRSTKQAELFVREIGNVNFIFYLYCDVVTLLDRTQQRSDKELNESTLKRDFIYATREIKLSVAKFMNKIENVNTSASPEDTFKKIEQVFARRLHLGHELAPEISAEVPTSASEEVMEITTIPEEESKEASSTILETKESEDRHVQGDTVEKTSTPPVTVEEDAPDSTPNVYQEESSQLIMSIVNAIDNKIESPATPPSPPAIEQTTGDHAKAIVRTTEEEEIETFYA